MVTACHTQLTPAQVQGTQIELGQGQDMEEQGVLGRAVSSPQEEGHMMMHIYQYWAEVEEDPAVMVGVEEQEGLLSVSFHYMPHL